MGGGESGGSRRPLTVNLLRGRDGLDRLVNRILIIILAE